MRTEFINLFAEINATELENLSREIKETVATQMHRRKHKTCFYSSQPVEYS